MNQLEYPVVHFTYFTDNAELMRQVLGGYQIEDRERDIHARSVFDDVRTDEYNARILMFNILNEAFDVYKLDVVVRFIYQGSDPV